MINGISLAVRCVLAYNQLVGLATQSLRPRRVERWDAEMRVTKRHKVSHDAKRLILRALRYILHSRLDPTRVTAHCKRVRLGRTQSERGQGQGYTTL